MRKQLMAIEQPAIMLARMRRADVEFKTLGITTTARRRATASLVIDSLT
jgi:hypothetical protein